MQVDPTKSTDIRHNGINATLELLIGGLPAHRQEPNRFVCWVLATRRWEVTSSTNETTQCVCVCVRVLVNSVWKADLYCCLFCVACMRVRKHCITNTIIMSKIGREKTNMLHALRYYTRASIQRTVRRKNEAIIWWVISIIYLPLPTLSYSAAMFFSHCTAVNTDVVAIGYQAWWRISIYNSHNELEWRNNTAQRFFRSLYIVSLFCSLFSFRCDHSFVFLLQFVCIQYLHFIYYEDFISFHWMTLSICPWGN